MEAMSKGGFANAGEQDRLRGLLESSQFTDVKITCSGHVWNAHKVLLVAKSAFFAAALCHDFPEARSSAINLPEDEPHIVARVLTHITTGEYPLKLRCQIGSQFQGLQDPYSGIQELSTSRFFGDGALAAAALPLMRRKKRKRSAGGFGANAPTSMTSAATNSPTECTSIVASIAAPITATHWERMNLSIELYAAGSRFLIPSLQEQAAAAFREEIRSHSWDGAITDQAEIVSLVDAIYTTTPDSDRALRNTIVELILREEKGLSVKEKTKITAMIESTPGFAVDMATCSLSGISWQCRICKTNQKSLLRKCACGKRLQKCREPDCVQEYVKGSVCQDCGESKTVAGRAFWETLGWKYRREQHWRQGDFGQDI